METPKQNIAIAVDGGGIKGVLVAKALESLEQALGVQALRERVRLVAGTSTGSVIAGGIALGKTAAEMQQLYAEEVPKVFQRTWKNMLWPVIGTKFPNEQLVALLKQQGGSVRMRDLGQPPYNTNLVITTSDVRENRIRFIKPYSEDFQNWFLWEAVTASASVPTYFPIWKGRYVDGGVSSYANPAFLAAFEAVFCLGWDPEETTIFSFGTGYPHPEDTWKGRRQPHEFTFGWEWLRPSLDTFLRVANRQQVRLVKQFFAKEKGVDFRRFDIQIDPVEVDDVSDKAITYLMKKGEELGQMVLNDETDPNVGEYCCDESVRQFFNTPPIPPDFRCGKP